MRKSNSRVPGHGLHKATGQGYVRLNGRMIYTGVYGTPEAQQRYERVLAEWLAGGRQLPPARESAILRVDKLVVLYWAHAETYYCRDGSPTHELDNIRLAVRPLVDLYRDQPVAEFGPKMLKTLREHLIDQGLARSTINSRISIIQRLFNWGAEEEHVPGTVAASIRAVRSLRKNRSRAKETGPVLPVSEEDFRSVLPHLPRQVAAMAELQWLTGMRPGEVTLMRWQDIEITEGEETWTYRPARHKTQHFGKERAISLGPKAQEVLGRFRKVDPATAIFAPADADADFRATKRHARKSELTPSQINREKAARRHPKRSFKPSYDSRTYAQAIRRACRAAEVPHWSPNQLRHSAATWIRKEYGIDAARAVLGHSSPAITEIYAELDLSQAAKLMAKFG